MRITGPDPTALYPLPDYTKVIFLKNFVKASNIIIGDYTYSTTVKTDLKNLRNTTSSIIMIFPK